VGLIGTGPYCPVNRWIFCDNDQRRPGGEIGRHSGLKIRRFPEMERAGSIPVPGTMKDQP
jgi:hypothetical protein